MVELGISLNCPQPRIIPLLSGKSPEIAGSCNGERKTKFYANRAPHWRKKNKKNTKKVLTLSPQMLSFSRHE
jgi:hypothetical protein